MWQDEPLLNRVSKGKRGSRNTRRLDENEVCDNEQSDNFEKPRTGSSLDEKLRTGGSLGCALGCDLSGREFETPAGPTVRVFK